MEVTKVISPLGTEFESDPTYKIVEDSTQICLILHFHNKKKWGFAGVDPSNSWFL